MSTAAFTFYRGAWNTDCGNDCHGAEGHREGHPDGLDMDLLAELVTDEGE